jgi:hypothetical protein
LKDPDFIRVDVVYTDGETATAISSEKISFMEGKLSLKGRNFGLIPTAAP